MRPASLAPTPAALPAADSPATRRGFFARGQDRNGNRDEDYRTVLYLMLFRVVLASVLLLCALSLVLTTARTESFSEAFAIFLFTLLGSAYLFTFVYALILPRVKALVRFAYLQIGVDLLLIAVLVHGTGGAQSAFTILFMIQVVAVALLPERYGAAYVAAASALMVLVVSIAGYHRLLPTVPGQSIFPWELTASETFFRLVLNVAAIATMGALGLNLSGQNLRVGERLVRHQRYAGDLASLHQNTIRCLSSGLLTVDVAGRITSINEAACEILGMDQMRALGRPLSQRIPGLEAVLEEAGPVGSVRRHEIDAVRPDGAIRNLGISATPLSDHTGRVIGRVLHFQDLTELRRMQQAVERSERLATIGRFAAGIAHEIRNPLASISGSVEMLRDLPGVEGESGQLVDIAVREVDRLNGLITDLLEYARPRAEEKHRFDLADLAAEIAMAFENERRAANLQIVLETRPGALVEGASGQLRQVLWNLLRNAGDAMPGGGELRVRAFVDTSGSERPEAVLAVEDTGMGIDQADLSHIFEPFFSKKRGGTGLGLAIVARVVEDHKGHLEVQSRIGAGTTFTVRLPLAATGA